MATTFVKIATVTLASSQAYVEFTSIPSTYTDLCLKMSLRGSDTADYGTMSINGSTSNFSSKRLFGDGVNAQSASRTDNLLIGFLDTTSFTANTFSNVECYYPNYSGSANKSFSIDGVIENNGTTGVQIMFAGLWSNTAAITSLRFTHATANFVQYSTATLYGISKS